VPTWKTFSGQGLAQAESGPPPSIAGANRSQAAKKTVMTTAIDQYRSRSAIVRSRPAGNARMSRKVRMVNGASPRTPRL
jgi:hypothetical protein